MPIAPHCGGRRVAIKYADARFATEIDSCNMPLLTLRDVHFTFRDPPLLAGVDLELNRGERVGLLGRNGSGKSTLMKLVAGELQPGMGQVSWEKGSRVSRLIQEVPRDIDGKIADVVREGLATEQHAGEPEEAWRADQAVKRALSRTGLNGELPFGDLSSGMKRRVLLARALVREPQLLLLDEPTNHLDIESIDWLERFLKSYDGAVLFVTHDRVFLQAIATRILEIDRGRIFDWACDYATFLTRKQAALEAEEKQNAEFDRKLAAEEAWIRQGIKARRTRNEGRVRQLKRLRDERQARRTQVGNIRLQANEAQRSGQLVLEADEISFSYGESRVVDQFSLLVTRGDRIGIMGPNGAGKTTLLRLLLGDLQPDSGTVRHGTRLQPLYFDQLQQTIDGERTVIDNVAEGQETIEIGDKKKHIYGYLQDFLFSPDRARQQAKFLSGGERHRLMLARLFKHPSNLMVLDEPTNDLDAETLDLLEELVANYSGTLLLVSHDRAFLNNVVTSLLVFEGEGQIRQYDGGYDDYRLVCEQQSKTAERSPKPAKSRTRKPKASAAKGLSYKERRELEELPARIDAVEQEQETLHATLADPSFYKQPNDEISRQTTRLETLSDEVKELYQRLEELMEKQ